MRYFDLQVQLICVNASYAYVYDYDSMKSHVVVYDESWVKLAFGNFHATTRIKLR